MPDERDIEKTLREYAKRRREELGEPPPLHPATRNLLQGEVARLGSRRPHRSQSWFQMLFGSGQRIAVSLSTAALVVVVAVAVLINLPRKQNYQMADSRRADEFRETAPGRDAVQPQRPGETAPAFAANDFLKNKDQDAVKKLEGAPAGGVAARQAPASNEVAFAMSNNLAQQSGRAQTATAPVISVDAAGAAVPATATLAVAAPAVPPLAKPDAAVTNYYFARSGLTSGVTAATRASAATNPAVLDSFRVEQDGGQIRIIDGDGSVYTGAMTPASAADVAQAREETPRLAAADKQIQTNSFRVSGTNITLRQTVEFTGNFVTTPLEAEALAQPQPTVSFGGGAAGRGGRRGGGGGGGGGFGGGGGRVPAPTNAPVATPAALGQTVATPATRFRIEGRAVVGTNQLEIKAEAVRQ